MKERRCNLADTITVCCGVVVAGCAVACSAKGYRHDPAVWLEHVGRLSSVVMSRYKMNTFVIELGRIRSRSRRWQMQGVILSAGIDILSMETLIRSEVIISMR